MNLFDKSFDYFFQKFQFPMIICDLSNIKASFPEYIVSLNKAALDLYEAWSIEEIKDNHDVIVPQNSLHDLIQLKDAILNNRNDFEIETLHVTCKNNKKNLLLKVVSEFNTTDHKTVLISIVDLTDYKKVLSEKLMLAKLPEINPDVVIIMRCDHTIKYVNPAGKLLFELKDERDYHKIDEFLPSLISNNVCLNCMEENYSKQEFYKNDRIYLLKTRPISAGEDCMLTLTDITDIKKLRRENELYSESLKSLDQAVIITDEKGKIKKVNRAFVKLYGFSEEELKGKNTRVLNPGVDVYKNLGFTKADYDKMFQSLWDNVSNPNIGKWEGTVINRTKNGKLLWVRLSISAIYSEDHQFYGYIALPIDETKYVNEMNFSKIELYKTIADLSEIRDNETGNHMRRVGLFSKLLAKSYGMPQKFCSDIENFAPMHDIGKVGIADSILLAPRKLTNDEFETMKTHTTFGYQIVHGKSDLDMAAEVTLYHHERYDGKGYPIGIRGAEIPLSARIVKIADVYDALRSKRPYKEPWTHKEAMNEIVENSGTQFDPVLIEHFVRLSEKIEMVYDELKDY